MIYRQIFIRFCLFALIALNANALPPPSPAGGGMLRLDEKHDFVGRSSHGFPINNLRD